MINQTTSTYNGINLHPRKIPHLFTPTLEIISLVMQNLSLSAYPFHVDLSFCISLEEFLSGTCTCCTNIYTPHCHPNRILSLGICKGITFLVGCEANAFCQPLTNEKWLFTSILSIQTSFFHSFMQIFTLNLILALFLIIITSCYYNLSSLILQHLLQHYIVFAGSMKLHPFGKA